MFHILRVIRTQLMVEIILDKLVLPMNTPLKAVQVEAGFAQPRIFSKSHAILPHLLDVRVIVFQKTHIISAYHRRWINIWPALGLQRLSLIVPVLQHFHGMVKPVQHVQLLLQELTMQCLKLVTNVRLFMNSMLSLASLVQHPFLDYATQLKIQN